MCAWLRSRGWSSATRYQELLKNGWVTDTLRQPRPELQADPVDGLPSPDPDQETAVDHDLAYTLHPGAQPVRRSVELRFDPKVVVPLTGRRDRRDRLHCERHRVGGPGSQEKLAALADGDVGDVPLLDLEDDAVVGQRRHLEEDLAALDGRTEGLTQISRHDTAIERRHDPGPGQLVVEQADLRAGLVDLRADDLDRGGVALGERLVTLPHELLGLAQPLEPLEPEFAVVERCEQLVLADHAAGAHRRLLDIAVERGDGGQTRPSLHHTPRRDPVIALGVCEQGDGGRQPDYAELERHVSRTDHVSELSPAGVGRLDDQPAIVTTLDLQNGPGHRGEHFAEPHRDRIELPLPRPLERQRADELPSLGQQRGAD